MKAIEMTVRAGFLGGLLAVLAAGAAVAQDRLTIQVGFSPGGSYDSTARIVAEYLPPHLPGSPDIIVENVPGAGSLVLGRLLMVDDNGDGERFATVSSALLLTPVFEPGNEDFDPTAVHYLAAMSQAASYCVTHRQSGIETLDDLLQSSDARVGATGRSSTTYTFPAALKNALDGQFQIVVGFDGGSEINLAMERGDIEARCGISYESLLADGMLDSYNIIAELSIEPRGEIEGPAFVLDRVEDPLMRSALRLVFSSGSVHHPYLAAPSTPPETVAALRAGFEAMVSNPEFLAVNAARAVPFDPLVGDALQARIADILSQPEEIQVLARDLVR